MDIIAHTISGFLLGFLVGGPLWFNLILAFFGALPDIIGYIEKIIKKNNQAWTWYEWAHECNIFCLIPSYCLHLILDMYTHGEGKRWWIKKERLWLEIFYWIFLLFLVYLVI